MQGNAGIVDQQRDASMPRANVSGKSFDAFFVGHVHAVSGNERVGFPEGLRRLLQTSFVNVSQRQRRACGSQLLRERPANARARSGYGRHPAAEKGHEGLPDGSLPITYPRNLLRFSVARPF